MSSTSLHPAAAGPVQLVELTAIRADESVWPRADLDWQRIWEFLELYQVDGVSVLPPLEVMVQPGGGFLLVDGWHRLAALKVMKAESAPVVVIALAAGADLRAAAFEHALARSAISAKPLTRAEKQAAVIRLIEAHPGASDREIGRLAGVDHKTVGRLRERGISPPPEHQRTRSGPRPELAARKLLEAFERVREARGLGLADWWRGGDRTGHRLADALLDVYGDEALERAQLCIDWLTDAIDVIEAAERER